MAVSTALVIDDSKSARIMLSRLVQKNGLEVNMVESGEEGLLYLESNPLPDVIFMDHMMPGLDGLQTTREIKKNPQLSHIPILMYTSKEGDAYEAEVKSSGAYAMLGKPAKPERLKELIDELNNIEPIKAATAVEIIVEQNNIELTETILNEPVTISTEEEEEEMSKELIEEVSTKLISRALEDALYPITSSLSKIETSTNENKSDIRKLTARSKCKFDFTSGFRCQFKANYYPTSNANHKRD